jgi:hypothetical protein
VLQTGVGLLLAIPQEQLNRFMFGISTLHDRFVPLR